jgi:hypothetical protein
MPISHAALKDNGPRCVSHTDCNDRDLWFTTYGDYKRRRMEVYGLEDWGGDIKPGTLF